MTLTMASALLASGAIAQDTRQGSLPDDVGQRIERSQSQVTKPVERIRSRLATRLDTRLRTRIDRSYRPQTDAQQALIDAVGENARQGQ